MKLTKDKFQKMLVENVLISEGLRYHLKHSIPLHENIYRPGSERFFSLICEARKWYNKGHLSLLEEDIDLINSDLGEWEIFEGKEVALDFPIEAEIDQLMHEGRRKKRKRKAKKKTGSYYRGRKVKLNKPKRGGSKKFYVYVRDPDTKNIRRIEFGAKGMTTGLRDPDRRRSFKNRHNCEDKDDKTKAGYWACRIGRYPKVTGAPYTTWW